MTFDFDKQLDHSSLLSLYENDLSYAQEVFEEFLAATRSEFEAIRNDYRENILKGMRQKLHKIKPTFSFVGLPSLTEKTETVIASCDVSSNIVEVSPVCLPLFKEIENSLVLIEKELFRMKKFAA